LDDEQPSTRNARGASKFAERRTRLVVHVDASGATTDFDDGTRDVLRRDDLRNLDRGWAISIHKAQGSAFRRVIVPVVESRLLDRTLVYTALTRAIDAVVFVGARETLRAAIECPTSAVQRRIGPAMLNL
jgi:exodeoxyribonuclease V alpha subunit